MARLAHGTIALFFTLCKASSSSLPTTTTTTTTSHDSSWSVKKEKHCVVVGGGPVGLAAALTLSRPPHSYNVTVLERSEMVQFYDPTRAYLYLINARGLEWINHYQNNNNNNKEAPPDTPTTTTTSTTTGLLEDLLTAGYAPPSTQGWNRIDIAADPATPIVDREPGASLNRTMFDAQRDNVWIARHEMVQVLMGTCCAQHNQHVLWKRNAKIVDDNIAKQKELGYIDIQSRKCVTALLDDRDDCIQIQCEDGSMYEATLVVAADGIDSQVRRVLANEEKTKTTTTTTNTHETTPSSDTTTTVVYQSRWLQSRQRQFRVRSYLSPSSGLRLKSLQFPPNFTLDNSDGSLLPSSSTKTYKLCATTKGVESMSLFLMPIKDATAVRPANIVTRADHVLWSIEHGPAMKAFMTQAFPRLPWDRLVDDTEWERFAQARGTTFCRPQYSPGSVVTSPYNPNVAVVMVGDACHAFPPDIGQGINAGLNDVLVLDRCLQGQNVVTGGKAVSSDHASTPLPSLAKALEQYQRNRRPEHAALIRLARFGAPYQYQQGWRRDRIGRKLWIANAAFRQMLNKISFGLVPPLAILTATYKKRPDGIPYTFRKVMRGADSTSFALSLILLVPLVMNVAPVGGSSG